ncbi:M23 family metallopeptidase [Piscinibacter sakaiensis]|uniref:M23 family metallopeptidase n=1 Tax=Piscinibacter sakaiensis TaxID=1547922 RepID=UPI003AAC9172
MQILVTHTSMSASRVLQFSRLQLVSAVLAVLMLLMLVCATVYHFVFLKAAREGWPVFSQMVQMVARDETAQRDRYLRENLDVMARKVGELQAKLIRLEAMGERVSGLAGVKPQDLRQMLIPAAGAASAPAGGGGKGGVYLPLPAEISTLSELDALVLALDAKTDQSNDVLTLVESRLFEKRLAALMVPNSRPVDGIVGSGFGFRPDPFTGRAALHTGLDFPADSGTAIQASAGGVVLQVQQHPQYGLMVELDHGRGLVTRYAHASKVLVKAGDLVRRGQPIAEVGSSGRSTGPHLHFEVLVDNVQQDPAKFLAGGDAPALASARLVAPHR